MTKAEKRVLKMVHANHIWLNALQCVRPTPKFCEGLGRQILAMLDEKENLLPKNGEVGDEMAELTPCLYLYINKS